MVGRTVAALVLTFAGWAVAQTGAQQSIAGTVTQFKGDPLEMGVQQDGGGVVFLKVGPDTQVVQVPPGERDLGKSKPAAIPDIVAGDRVLVSMVAGMQEARRVILISAREIVRRNESEKADWQKRGIGGLVTAKTATEVQVELRTPEGSKTTTVALNDKTSVRRYASDSVKFADAKPSSIAEIEVGDQLKARGDKTEDGTKMIAQDIVFGTFLTKVGSITEIDREIGVIKLKDLSTNQPLTVRLTSDSQIRLMPDSRQMFMSMMMAGKGGGGHDPQHAQIPVRFDMAQFLERLASGKLDDLKAGGAVIVSSTKGAKSDELTAITILANADFLLQVAMQTAGQGVNAAEAIGRMHGGMLAGPTGGISLPAMIP